MLRRIIALGLAATLWATPNPDATLVDQNGKAFQFHSLKGNYVFVSFVFTRCPMPKMCPLTMTLTQQLNREWKTSHPNLPLKFLIVTLDPKHDTPAVLKKFGDSRRVDYRSFTFATGDEKALETFASNFNVIGVPGEGIISHNAKSVLLAPDLSDIKMYKDNEWTPQEVLKDLKNHLKSQTPTS